MSKIRGKSLKEWKEYCKEDDVPLKTMKYIVCLEEKVEELSIVSEVEDFKMYEIMQYYMEYCGLNGYVTPREWIEKHKHF